MKYDEYKTYNELSEESKRRVIRSDRLFSLANNFPMDNIERIKKQLYKYNGTLAGITIEERDRWRNIHIQI